MSQFVVSARKYRPSTFQSVVGQDHITGTLKNAIANSHLAQSFLFCGPRGVGKTTCARILAKTINCNNITNETEACNECESCISFNNGQSLNIFELDAASNNSVDDIRVLVEQVRFAPHSGKFKIYIIDEVHMLTTQAFNAFLKTLEEPPSYAIFILATTEKHKIIPTILSRCQIFDFNRIKIDDIAKHLDYVAKAEHVNAEKDALHIIAQKADGALRDALSIFDQIVSFSGSDLTYKKAIANLSVLDYDYYFKICDQLLASDNSGLLLTFNELLNDGFECLQFLSGLASHFRDLMVCKDSSTLVLLEVSETVKTKYADQSKQFPTAFLFICLDLCNRTEIEFKAAKNQRLAVELCLLKMCSLTEQSSLNFANFIANEKKNPELKTKPKVENVIEQPAKIETTSNKIAATAIRNGELNDSAATYITNDNKKDISNDSAIVEPISSEILSTINSSVKPKSITSRIAGTSLSALQNKVEEEIKILQNDNSNKAKTDFKIDELLKIWNNYKEQQHIDGKLQLVTVLKLTKIELKDDYVVELTLENQTQENSILEVKQDLIDYLRNALNNFYIQVNTIVVEIDQSEYKILSDKEKYMEMVKKKPELDDLRKQLGLELL